MDVVDVDLVNAKVDYLAVDVTQFILRPVQALDEIGFLLFR